jgi:YegS/Rv2252/BmrU family lipid kinase
MQTQEKIVFLFNPKSGRNTRVNLKDLIHRYLDTNIYEPFFYETQYAGHASELVYEYARQGVTIFVAIGGDGTVNEVASSAHQLGLTVGIIPKGSGNGLARSLDIPMNPKKAIECLNKKNIRTIDAGAINDRFFFCTCGTGFDAKIGHKFAHSARRGFISYVKAILKEYGRYSAKKYRLKIDGVNYKRKAFLVTVANAGQYGNNAYISPKSSLNDGKLEVCIFKPFPWYTSLRLSLRLFVRNIDKSNYTEYIQAESIVFRKKKKYLFHLDGEPIKFEGKVKITVLPGALKVIAANAQQTTRKYKS